jgi:hypothetical protein
MPARLMVRVNLVNSHRQTVSGNHKKLSSLYDWAVYFLGIPLFDPQGYSSLFMTSDGNKLKYVDL